MRRRGVSSERRRSSCSSWFCYQLIAKPGNKTAAPPLSNPFLFVPDNESKVLQFPNMFRKVRPIYLKEKVKGLEPLTSYCYHWACSIAHQQAQYWRKSSTCSLPSFYSYQCFYITFGNWITLFKMFEESFSGNALAQPSISCSTKHRVWISLVIIGPANGLILYSYCMVRSDNKPSPEPIFTQIYVIIWCH